MKKLLLSLFVILTVFTITACKKEENKEEQIRRWKILFFTWKKK